MTDHDRCDLCGAERTTYHRYGNEARLVHVAGCPVLEREKQIKFKQSQDPVMNWCRECGASGGRHEHWCTKSPAHQRAVEKARARAAGD